MFIKAVYSIIDPPTFSYRSIISNSYALQYVPGEWTTPALKGSRLFVYNNLFSAIQVHGKPVITKLPYIGMTLWTCYVVDAVRIDPLKEPSEEIIRRFWKARERGISPYHGIGYDMFPWINRFKRIPAGVHGAKSVMLLNIMGPDDWKELPSPVVS